MNIRMCSAASPWPRRSWPRAARLDARGLPTNPNPNRINSRIDNRINNRRALRIERYRPDSIDDPTAAFAIKQDDRSRVSPVITPPAPVDEP